MHVVSLFRLASLCLGEMGVNQKIDLVIPIH